MLINEELTDRRIDNCIRAKENSHSTWAKQYWDTVIKILIKDYTRNMQ